MFGEVNHLFGIYLSKKHEAKLLETFGDSFPIYAQTKEKLYLEEKEAHQVFMNYISTNGTEKCPYIERIHGEEISLLTEIVYFNNKR